MKRKLSLTLLGLFFIYLIYGLFLSRFELRIIPVELVSNNPKGFYDYKGVVNVHSNLSTGSGDFDQIIRSAQRADLDFIFITDLNDFDPPNHLEGYHNKLLVFIDGEYSYLNSRLLNLDAVSADHLRGLGRSQVLFADLLSQKGRNSESGMFILSHPFKPGYKWSGDYPIGLDGLEIINLKSIWQQAWLNSKASFLWTLLVFPFNDRLALMRLFHDPLKEITLWDQLSSRHPLIGIAGSDAESKVRITSDTFLKFPSYETLFSLVSNHILLKSELTGQTQGDRKKITQALRKGQFYMSLDTLANPRGFNAVIQDREGKIHGMGSTLPWQKGHELIVTLPRKPNAPFDVVIYKDGEEMMISTSQETRLTLHEPGVYRVKVRVIPTFPLPDGKKWVPWIYTNPFYIGQQKS